MLCRARKSIETLGLCPTIFLNGWALFISETHISKAEGALKYDGRTNPDIRRDCWFNTSGAPIPLIGSRACLLLVKHHFEKSERRIQNSKFGINPTKD